MLLGVQINCNREAWRDSFTMLCSYIFYMMCQMGTLLGALSFSPAFFVISDYIILSWMQFQGRCKNVWEMGTKTSGMWHELFPVSGFKTLIFALGFLASVWGNYFEASLYCLCKSQCFAHSSDLQISAALCFSSDPICLMIMLNRNSIDRWSPNYFQ